MTIFPTVNIEQDLVKFRNQNALMLFPYKWTLHSHALDAQKTHWQLLHRNVTNVILIQNSSKSHIVNTGENDTVISHSEIQ
jgi:hypothetical protein